MRKTPNAVNTTKKGKEGDMFEASESFALIAPEPQSGSVSLDLAVKRACVYVRRAVKRIVFDVIDAKIAPVLRFTYFDRTCCPVILPQSRL